MSTAPLALEGALSFPTVGEILARIGSADIAEIDLSRVSHVDSAGLSLLLELTRRARRGGQTLQIHKAPLQVRELAGFFGLSQILGLDVA